MKSSYQTRHRKLVALLVSVLLLSPVAALVDEYSSTRENFQKSQVGQSFFNSAYGYAVFPTIGKGGLGIGAAHGNGQVYKQGAMTGETAMTQLSIGFQAGGQAYSQVIFFEDKAAYDKFTSGNFEFAAGANAIAITASVGAQSSTTGNSSNTGADAGHSKQGHARYKDGMAVLTIAKGGLMYEASLAGQKYSFDPA